MNDYDFKLIESKWRAKWDDAKIFSTTEDTSKEKFYALIEFPYPSGAGLHCGHTRAFTAMDIVSRLKRMQGYNVLYPIGYDEFGFPTEKYAIATGIQPEIATKQNTDTFTRQLKSLGYCFDWDRCVGTSDPNYFKWTQWMFIQLVKHGIAYRGVDTISWCDNCKIGIANEELENGKCERCGGEVIQKEKSQWMLKMQSYSEKLLNGLDTVDYPENVKKMQTDWIGKSVGCEIKFSVKIDGKIVDDLVVFTTRPDTIFGATYLVIAPEHSILENCKDDSIVAYQHKAKTKTSFERTELQKEKTGVKVQNMVAINPVNNVEIPIFVSDYVIMGYGTGAIMAVPAHDERDFEFAQRFDIPIIPVITGCTEENGK
ncbi:MAG: class I tRNA ligase family protein, partial [Rickettsiales bacterium]|nr:class I tRNA ligase family protein [Rickettsiales bacterium]